MKITLVPRAAPPGRLRVWIGVLAKAPPALTWAIARPDGSAVAGTQVKALRALASAIPEALLGGRAAQNFTGVYEIGGLAPGTAYVVTASTPDGTSGGTLYTRTLPSQVPPLLDRPFNVLLVSCFHSGEDRHGAGVVAAQLTGPATPDLTLLLGDQVYLDLPTLANFRKAAPALAQKFEGDYRANWQGEAGYSQLLALAPTASLPDDHEYWNNFPHASPIIQNSWKPEGRKSWTAAATALYEAFQFSYEDHAYLHGDAAQLGDAQVIDVEPLTFFLADGRSRRDPDRHWVLTQRGLAQLDQWVTSTIAEKRVGVFITGQSLLDPPASSYEGRVADYAMPNYDDFLRITQTLARIPSARLPLILVTGDVHWGRVARIQDTHTGAAIYEIISSPTSLVSTVGKDQWRRIWDAARGGGDGWPRHSEAADVSDFLWSSAFDKRFTCRRIHPQKGNHIALLSFVRSGAGVRLRTTYYPIHDESAHREPRALDEITLAPV